MNASIHDDNLRQTIGNVAAHFRKRGAKAVYIFGSAAHGKSREGSDVDFAVEGLPPESFFNAMGEAFSILGRDLDLVDLDEDTPFTRALRDNGDLVRVG